MNHSRFEVRKKAVNRTAGERQRLAHKVKREMKVCNHWKLLPHFLSSPSSPHLQLPLTRVQYVRSGGIMHS